MFHTMDLALTNENIDVSQQQFACEITVKAPLTLDGQLSLFQTRQNQLMFAKKPLQPYVNGETKAELLSKPLPSIYPLSRNVSIFESNIYRREHTFRMSARQWQFCIFECINSHVSQLSGKEHRSIDCRWPSFSSTDLSWDILVLKYRLASCSIHSLRLPLTPSNATA